VIPRTWSAVAACGETFVVLAEQPISALLYCGGEIYYYIHTEEETNEQRNVLAETRV
jgi:hypothetical protein